MREAGSEGGRLVGRHRCGPCLFGGENALFKVIKARDAHALGSHPVVQGGTFCSAAFPRRRRRVGWPWRTRRLTVNDFGRGADGKPRRHISGNRCERGASRLAPERAAAERDIPDMVDYKRRRLFGYEPLSAASATRPTVGIPRRSTSTRTIRSGSHSLLSWVFG